MASVPTELRVARRIAERAESRLLTTFLRSVRASRLGISEERLWQILDRSGLNLRGLVTEARIDTFAGELLIRITPELQGIMWRGAIAGAPGVARQFPGKLRSWRPSRAAMKRRAAQFARGRAGTLVQGVRAEQIQTIRDLVARGFTEGVDKRRIARLIGDTVGLDPKRALAHERVAAGIEARPDLKDYQKRRLIKADAHQRANSRGRAISRNEASRAATQAQTSLWEEAVDDGTLRTEDWEVAWEASSTACPICAPLDGLTVAIGEAFPDPGGDGPPDPHPGCQCNRRLIRKRGDE